MVLSICRFFVEIMVVFSFVVVVVVVLFVSLDNISRCLVTERSWVQLPAEETIFIAPRVYVK